MRNCNLQASLGNVKNAKIIHLFPFKEMEIPNFPTLPKNHLTEYDHV